MHAGIALFLTFKLSRSMRASCPRPSARLLPCPGGCPPWTPRGRAIALDASRPFGLQGNKVGIRAFTKVYTFPYRDPPTILYTISVLTGDTLMKYYKYFLADQPTGLPFYISDEFHDDLERFGQAWKWWREYHRLSDGDLTMWGSRECSKEEYDANQN